MRIIMLVPLLAITALSACETVQGAGRDMQTAGRMITEQSYSNSPTAAAAQPQVRDPYATPQPF